MRFGKTTPILRIFDEAKALEFYVDFLGFSLDWQHRFEANFPLYLQVSRGDCVLHLSEHHGDATPGSALRIETDELPAFHQQLLAKDYRYAHPEIQTMPWGSQDMTINDPFGNRLVFTNAICV
ncbi:MULTISPECIES: glyoxalase superfamily protein [unclassified Pseudomonas]|uniref:glyoxalase superfamily protein n=1 Tax=unclassified Pseudomonas TaxID=196821 RepID=UPI000BA464E6|nr:MULTISPECIES: glyoxalase superfamily protein [unclassified Pseudomonas]